MPLSDVIPLLQRAADRIESDAARIRELEAKNARLTIDSGYYADNAAAAMKWYENAERKLAASRERERALREALRALYEWYYNDGSVGGAANVFEEYRALAEQGAAKC